MRLVLGSDHAGYTLKQEIATELRGLGHEVLDVGTTSLEPVDYPDFAEAVGRAVVSGRGERGILICGSGVGASVAANKIRGVRAAVCHDTYSAHQGVEHDDMNVLCIGARVIGPELAFEIMKSFLSAQYAPQPRHAQRVAKILEIERKALRGEYAHSKT